MRLDLSEDHLDQDAVITAVLRQLLDMNVTPRTLAEGRSLEKHFLEVTRDTKDAPAGQ